MSRDRATAVLERLAEIAGDASVASHARLGDATVVVALSDSRRLLERMRNDEALAFDLLVDVTAVDYPESDPRFAVVYHLYSTAGNHRLRVKVHVPEEPCMIDSVVDLWPAANWLEREVFDLYGIVFRGHPELQRILLEPDFEGHPLRKDFPKRGHDAPSATSNVTWARR